MNSTFRFLISVLLALFAAQPLSAQTVQGELVEQGTGEPINGALIVLLDEGEEQHGGALTGENGQFTLRAPAPGRYTLRAERIGYMSTASPVLTLEAGQTLEYRMVAQEEAIDLGGIIVEGERRCEIRPEEGLRTHQLWEEARKALNAAAWTQDQRLFKYDLVLYERELDLESLRVQSERTRSSSGFSDNPFVSIPVEELAEHGYVQNFRDSTLYHAPDAHILLSDLFLDNHCFQVREGGGEEEGLVGLAFEPVRERGQPDVRGVLWLDEQTAELRFLDYHYTGLRMEGPTDEVGGRVEFERLPTGAWIVRRWRIRMPTKEIRRAPWMGTSKRREVMTHLTEKSGEITDIFMATGARVRGAERAALAGTVFRQHPCRAPRKREGVPIRHPACGDGG